MDDRNDFQRRIGVGEPSRISLKMQGGARTKTVVREVGRTRGSVAGTTTEHWDGRVDATATPETVRATVRRSTGEIVDMS